MTTTVLVSATYADRRSEVEEIFNDIDSNDDNLISVEEMDEALQEAYDINLPKDTLQKIFSKFDGNNDGQLNLEEFDSLLLLIDEKDDGKISDEDLIKAILA